jgi:hypothetical protein
MNDAVVDPVDETLDRRRPNQTHIIDIEYLIKTSAARGFPDLEATFQLLGDQNDARGRMVRQLKAEINRLLKTPPVAWWIKDDGDPFDRDPELFASERAAKDEAIRGYREANDVGRFGDDDPDFAWREHREGGSELYVDGEATGLIVRRVAVSNGVKAVAVDYAPEHHEDVEPVCTRCHRLRESARRAAPKGTKTSV